MSKRAALYTNSATRPVCKTPRMRRLADAMLGVVAEWVRSQDPLNGTDARPLRRISLRGRCGILAGSGTDFIWVQPSHRNGTDAVDGKKGEGWAGSATGLV